MSTQTLLVKQHQENQVWLNKLSFYKDDLVIMQNRLDEVTAKNNNPSFLKDVEHFQNQFIIQKEQLDILRHEVKQVENSIEKSVEANPIATDHRHISVNYELNEKLSRFEELFSQLRKELFTFLAKWM